MSAEDRVTERLRRMRTGIRHIAIGQAYTGKFSEATGGLYKNPAITLDTGYVWVRREGSRHATRALNTNGRAPLNKVNVSVIVGERVRDGELEILDADWTTGIAQFGDGVYAAYQPQQTQSTRDIDEGRVYLAQAGTLKFRARPFFYTADDGNRAWWPDNLGSEVTVTLTTASSTEHQLAVIALNSDATTPALTATMSTPVGTSQSLTREDAIGVTLTSGYIALAAVHLYHGDATPRGEDHIWDLRPWFEGAGGGGSGSDANAIHDNVAGEISALTEKASPTNSDLLVIEDAADSYAKKKVQIGNLPSSGGGSSPYTPPDDADFSWVNQNSATVSTTGGLLHLHRSAAAVSEIHGRVQTANVPATPWKLTAALQFLNPHVNYSLSGLFFRESSSGKLVTFCWVPGYGNYMISEKWNSPTSFSAEYTLSGVQIFVPPLWWRLEDDGTNRKMSFSNDGVNFRTVHTVGRTDFLTGGANQVGFFVNNRSSSPEVGITVLSWEIA